MVAIVAVIYFVIDWSAGIRQRINRVSWALKQLKAASSQGRPGDTPTKDADLDLLTLQEKLVYETAKLEFIKNKHRHWEWWVDFLVRVVLTGCAAWFTYAWITYLQEVVTSIPKYRLSEAIIIALLTTTTANVLGAWAIVARYVWKVRPANAKSLPSIEELAPPSDTDDESWVIRPPGSGRKAGKGSEPTNSKNEV